MFIAVLFWVNWQQRYILEQRHNQFAILNAIGSSLRETLELSEVLDRTWRTLSILIAADSYTVALRDEENNWNQSRQVIRKSEGNKLEAIQAELNSELAITFEPDDFTLWVINRGRALDLTERNMHFAGRHNLVPPDSAHKQPSKNLASQSSSARQIDSDRASPVRDPESYPTETGYIRTKTFGVAARFSTSHLKRASRLHLPPPLDHLPYGSFQWHGRPHPEFPFVDLNQGELQRPINRRQL